MATVANPEQCIILPAILFLGQLTKYNSKTIFTITEHHTLVDVCMQIMFASSKNHNTLLEK